MRENKTKPTKQTATSFINSIEDTEQKKDAKELLKIYKEITKEKPVIWSNTIVGFGTYHYISKSKCEGDWMLGGFSPRKNGLSLYLMYGFDEFGDLLEKLGPHKTGAACLNIKRLSDVHVPTLKKLIKKCYVAFKKENT